MARKSKKTVVVAEAPVEFAMTETVHTPEMDQVLSLTDLEAVEFAESEAELASAEVHVPTAVGCLDLTMRPIGVNLTFSALAGTVKPLFSFSNDLSGSPSGAGRTSQPATLAPGLSVPRRFL